MDADKSPIIPPADIEKVKEYANTTKFPFENLVFNGGGAKCIAQVGTLKMFEETGILKNIHRFGGSSGGALTATFAAVGYTPDMIEKILIDKNLENIVKGKHCMITAALIILRNLCCRYGVYDADTFERWLGFKIAEKTDDMGNHFDRNLTFSQLYEKRKVKDKDGKPQGIELAITATDITRKDTVFFHKKTYPDVPIKTAIRMSMSIPLFFTPVRNQPRDEIGWYVDGGVLCNYPVMCYDGWYLSMKRENNFWHRLNLDDDNDFDDSLETRFNCEPQCREKTVGVMVYAEDEADTSTEILGRRIHKGEKQQVPDTKLGRARKKYETKLAAQIQEHTQRIDAMDKIIEVMKTEPHDEGVSREQLQDLLDENPEFKTALCHLLELPIVNADDVFRDLDVPFNEEVKFHHFNAYCERVGLQIIHSFQVVIPPESFHGNIEYVQHIIDTYRNSVARAQFKKYDLKRTIGINTEYLSTFDFGMKKGDKKYLIEQGRIGTIAFLLYFIEERQNMQNGEDVEEDDY